MNPYDDAASRLGPRWVPPETLAALAALGQNVVGALRGQRFTISQSLMGCAGTRPRQSDPTYLIPLIGQSLIWREPVPPRRSKGWRRHVRAQKAAKR